MRRCLFALIFALILVFCSAAVTRAQSTPAGDATIVVFTPGGHWRGAASQLKTMAFGKADAQSMGTVFDGDDPIGYLSHSRYLQMRIPAGTHTFSTSIGRKPSKKQQLTLDLKPGSVTYMAITTTLMNYGAGIYSTMASHIEAATCQEFVEANRDHPMDPVGDKHVNEPLRPRLEHGAVPADCAP